LECTAVAKDATHRRRNPAMCTRGRSSSMKKTFRRRSQSVPAVKTVALDDP
jgi:hypothetical protein